jgi:hypothetical protein
VGGVRRYSKLMGEMLKVEFGDIPDVSAGV